jgi:tetratricopeptide (TPR) repeat protein
MHELLQRYLGGKLQQSADLRTQVAASHCEYFGNLLANPVDLLSKEALRKAAQEIDNIRASWQYAVDQQLLTIIRQMTPGFAKLLILLGQYQQGEMSFARAQQILFEKTQAKQNALIARQAFFCAELGRADKARKLLQLVLDDLAQADDPETEAYAREMMGHVLERQGIHQEAENNFAKSLTLYQQLNDIYGLARAFSGLGLALNEQGNFEEASNYYEQALALYEKSGDYRGQAWVLNDLAVIAYRQMDFKSAATIMKKGGKILRKLEDPYFLMIYLNNQAIFASTPTIREYDKAKGLAIESYSLAGEMGLKVHIAYSLTTLGYLEIETEAYDKAIPFFQDSLQQYRATDANHEAGNALCGLGKAYFFLGEDELAYECFVESIKIALKFEVTVKLLLPIVGIARILNGQDKKE